MTEAKFSRSRQTRTPTNRFWEVGKNMWLSLQEKENSQGRSSHMTALVNSSPTIHPKEPPMRIFMGSKAAYFGESGETAPIGVNLKTTQEVDAKLIFPW